MEQLLIKKIEAAIRGIKFGTRTPSEVEDDVAKYLERLKASNQGMSDELSIRYRNVVKDYNGKKLV